MAKAPGKTKGTTTGPEVSSDKATDTIEDAVVLDEPTGDDLEATPVETSETEPLEDASSQPEVEATTPASPAPAAPKPRRGGVGTALGLIAGGILAAVIGFTAARTVVPEGWPFPGVAPTEDPLVAVVAAQDAKIAGLESRIAAATDALATLQADESDAAALAATNERIAGFGAQMDDLTARIEEMEKTAPGGGTEAAQAAAAAYERELADIRAMVEAELAKVAVVQDQAKALEANAAEAATAASARAALARVTVALDTGRPFDDALFDLTTNLGVDAPTDLASLAATGVPTLATLQQDFPDAARAALDAATRAAVEDGSVNRFTAFLRTQLGTRSLEPKEGDDADAVLSRAEDALRKGEIDAALSELAALPDAAQPALADWKNRAETRVAALAAAGQLAAELNAK